MRAISTWLLAGATYLHLAAANHPHHPDAPSVDRYLRRTHPRAVVIGDYVYIEGGEISKDGIDKDLDEKVPGTKVNSTLSIDLSKSWSPDEVVMKVTEKSIDVPRMQSHGLLTDYVSGSFYIFGGLQAFNQAPASRGSLWRFRTDGSGGGTWTTETSTNMDLYIDLNRTEMGSWASTQDTGFYLGGTGNQRTASEQDRRGSVPGIVSYNFTTKVWANDSSAGLSPDGSLHGASATFVPDFGPNGLVVLIGGSSRFRQAGQGSQPMDLITFFDPVTKQTFARKTSGQPPEERFSHCAVGVKSTNNTFEIFVFGGTSLISGRAALDDVWILSLPGFVWHKADYPPEHPRVGHTCVVAGNRQLLSIGGFNNNMPNPAWWRDKDNFPQGLGIFDLTDLEWKSSYDTNAAPYESPKQVKAWYETNGVEDLDLSAESDLDFDGGNGSNSDGGSGGNGDGEDGSNRSGGSSSNGGSNNENSGSSGPPVGAMAGGVVGGVVALAAVTSLVWFCRRRRRLDASSETGTAVQRQPEQHHHHAQTIYYDALEKQGSTPASELHADSNRVELPDSTIPPAYVEMDATNYDTRYR